MFIGRIFFCPSYFVTALAFLHTGIRKEVRLQRRRSGLEFRIETLLERLNYNEAINLPIGLLPRNPRISRNKWDNILRKDTLKFCTPIPLKMPQANMSSNSLQRRYILSYYILTPQYTRKRAPFVLPYPDFPECSFKTMFDSTVLHTPSW